MADKKNQNVHGLPVKVQLPNGETTVAFFASCRREPKLRDIAVQIHEIQDQILVLGEQAQEAEAASGKSVELIRKMRELRDKHLDLVRQFYETGLKAAGYSDEDVEELIPGFRVDMFDEVYMMAYAGMGAVDFTSGGD